ncbi:hypothetical protein ACFL6Y_10620 [Elusimicrobiota bacterium]
MIRPGTINKRSKWPEKSIKSDPGPGKAGNLRAEDGAARGKAYVQALKRGLAAAGARQTAFNIFLGPPVGIDRDMIKDTLDGMGVSGRMANDIGRITFRKVPSFYPEGLGGMSLGREILLKDPHPEDKGIIVHEWVHSQQQLDKGFLSFLTGYYYQYLTKGYEAASYEKDAYNFQYHVPEQR